MRGGSLRVALVEPAGRGGIRHYTDALARALERAGHRVLLLTARDDELVGDSAAHERTARLFDRLKTPAWSVLRQLKSWRPDVVHLQTATHPALHLAFLAGAQWATKVPGVVTAHNLAPKLATRSDVWASDALYRRSQRVIVHGEQLARTLRARLGMPADHVSVIPHGHAEHLLDGDVRPIDVHATPTVLFFGFLHPEKDPETLLDAWRVVHEARPDARLLVAGRPEMDLAPLHRRAREHGTESSITWRSHYLERGEMHACFQESTTVVLPYADASMSGVLFLAGAHHRPVVATRSGALEEVLTDGEGGRLVPPRDPARLAAALLELIDDPFRARRWGTNHAARCRNEFGWDAIAERTASLYHDVVATKEMSA